MGWSLLLLYTLLIVLWCSYDSLSTKAFFLNMQPRKGYNSLCMSSSDRVSKVINPSTILLSSNYLLYSFSLTFLSYSFINSTPKGKAAASRRIFIWTRIWSRQTNFLKRSQKRRQQRQNESNNKTNKEYIKSKRLRCEMII